MAAAWFAAIEREYVAGWRLFEKNDLFGLFGFECVAKQQEYWAGGSGQKKRRISNMRQIYKGEIEEKLVKQSSMTTQRNEL